MADNPTALTDDQIIARGERACALLSSQMFVDTIGVFMNDHLSAILASADDDVETREKNFRQLRAYEAVLHNLRAYVEAANEVLLARGAVPDRDDLEPEQGMAPPASATKSSAKRRRGRV